MKTQPPNGASLCRDTLAIVLAGGQGTRLRQLTRLEAKPALPFGGQYRHIDFPLSNCVNSGLRRVSLLTQYMAHSLIQHVQQGWSFLRPDFGEFVEVWPAQQRVGSGWYAGTADAVYQNLDLIAGHDPAYVLVLAGDHIYRMDYLPMLESHVASGADVTVGCVEVPLAEASDFGVLQTTARDWVLAFSEKPRRPDPMPGRPGSALASMGIYVFDREYLFECLAADAANAASRHDFGGDVLPAAIHGSRVLAFPFRNAATGEPGYWRDIGTVERYWQANMDLLAEPAGIDLHDTSWPIWTRPTQYPPVRFGAQGGARNSIVADGCRIDGTLSHSVACTCVSVGRGALVENTVLLPGARVGRNCIVRNAVVDSNCEIPDGTAIDELCIDEAPEGAASGRSVVVVTRGTDRPVEAPEVRRVA